MFTVTVRYQTTNRETKSRSLPNWAAVNEYIVGLGKTGPFPRGTVATVVAPEGASKRYSLRGGGPETVKMVALSESVHGV